MADPKDRPERQESPSIPANALGQLCGRTMQKSVYKHRWPRRLPAEAPNILIAFIDDAGPLPATFGSEVQTPTNRPHCPQRHGRGSRHNLHGSLGLRGRANKPSANLFEPLSLGREVVESVARDHQCRTTLNSTYFQHLEDERLALI